MDFQQALLATAQVFALAAFFAFINERIVEHYLKPFSEKIGDYAQYVAGVTGLLLAIGFNIDFLSLLTVNVLGIDPIPYAGVIVSGLMIGGGSNLIHDIWPLSQTNLPRTETFH